MDEDETNACVRTTPITITTPHGLRVPHGDPPRSRHFHRSASRSRKKQTQRSRKRSHAAQIAHNRAPFVKRNRHEVEAIELLRKTIINRAQAPNPFRVEPERVDQADLLCGGNSPVRIPAARAAPETAHW